MTDGGGSPDGIEDRINELEATMQENFRFLARSADINGGNVNVNSVSQELENHTVQIKTIHQQVCFLVTQVVQLRQDMDSAQETLARVDTVIANGPVSSNPAVTVAEPMRTPEPRAGAGVSAESLKDIVTFKDLQSLADSLNQAVAKKVDVEMLVSEMKAHDTALLESTIFKEIVQKELVWQQPLALKGAVKEEVRMQIQAQMESNGGIVATAPRGQQLATTTGTPDIAAAAKTMEIQQQRMMSLMDVLARQVNSLAKQLAALGRTVNTGGSDAANPDSTRGGTGEAPSMLGSGMFGSSRPGTGAEVIATSGYPSAPPNGGAEPRTSFFGGNNGGSQWFGSQWFGGSAMRPSGGWAKDDVPRSDGALTQSQFIEVDRSSGESLGLELDGTSEGATNADFLMVVGIQDGLIKAWNVGNRERMIAVYDRIIQVNDVRGRALSLLQELQKSKKLKIKIQRTQTSV